MNANQDILQGKWPELKGQVKKHWVKLTNDDLRQLSGTTSDLVGVLRQRYGYGQVQAAIEIRHWVSDHDAAPIKV
jgi:uncharacterized protein YjbJ (UPF0337 family)